jgi:hypothetical protein
VNHEFKTSMGTHIKTLSSNLKKRDAEERDSRIVVCLFVCFWGVALLSPFFWYISRFGNHLPFFLLLNRKE